MFSFPLSRGDAATALSRPGSLVLTEDAARKYFGATDPLGKTVTVNNAHAFTVTGVLKKPPRNSTLTFEMLVPSISSERSASMTTRWGTTAL
jgi:putative ABC transport system permease protein